MLPKHLSWYTLYIMKKSPNTPYPPSPSLGKSEVKLNYPSLLKRPPHLLLSLALREVCLLCVH